jgi:antirestriction protein ArdC
LERGVRPWIKPWDDIAPPDALVLPLRSCGTPYRGINIIALWAASLESGFRSRHWFTFKQALAMKACVRKGERGSFVVYYTELGDKSEGDGKPSPAPRSTGANGGETGETRRILRGYTVFNADQIEGLPDAFYALEELVAELASAFIGAHIGLPADHLEDHASYIDGWLKALGDNPSSFLTAASKAQATADWVLREMGVG